MSFELKQYLKLAQQLIITPQLQQAIKLLQLNHLELKQELDKALTENPCLEAEPLATDTQNIEALKSLIKSTVDNQESGFSGRSSHSSSKDSPSFEQFVSKPETLTDYLEWQLQHTSLETQQQAIAKLIVGNLDEQGFLTQPIDLIAQKCNTSQQEAEAVLYIIQQFDPIGVASRDLRECLLNQLWSLKVKPPVVKLAEEIIEKHFDHFFRRSVSSLERKLHLPKTEIVEACSFLSQLNPKPGAAFTESSPHLESISPDVFITKRGTSYHIQINDDGLPKLKVSKKYLTILEGKSNQKDIEYVQEKVKNALWLVKSLEQRQRSIHKVAASILKQQKDFFEKGPEYIQPMILKQVAEDVGLHESTISRITRGKYMQTPHGVFELKYFFNTQVTASTEDIGTRNVKQKIQALIAQESLDAPITDAHISKILNNEGIRLARRTVARYRELLGILPAKGRKKKF
jgi:RNA polymerase sigma-54 factor